MKKLKICLEIDGLAQNENGERCPGGMCITMGAEDGEVITGDEYKNICSNVNIKKLLEYFGLDGVFSPSDCRFISPEEYEVNYGD